MNRPRSRLFSKSPAALNGPEYTRMAVQRTFSPGMRCRCPWEFLESLCTDDSLVLGLHELSKYCPDSYNLLMFTCQKTRLLGKKNGRNNARPSIISGVISVPMDFYLGLVVYGLNYLIAEKPDRR